MTKSSSPDSKDYSDRDARSIYVKNVDYSTNNEELETYFEPCGVINKVTIIKDKKTLRPKGK